MCVFKKKKDFFPFLKNDVKLDITPLRMQKISWTRLNARRFTLYEFGATKNDGMALGESDIFIGKLCV